MAIPEIPEIAAKRNSIQKSSSSTNPMPDGQTVAFFRASIIVSVFLWAARSGTDFLALNPRVWLLKYETATPTKNE